MTFLSKAQAKFMMAIKPSLAKEFAKKTISISKLPEHTEKKEKDKRPVMPKKV